MSTKMFFNNWGVMLVLAGILNLSKFYYPFMEEYLTPVTEWSSVMIIGGIGILLRGKILTYDFWGQILWVPFIPKGFHFLKEVQIPLAWIEINMPKGWEPEDREEIIKARILGSKKFLLYEDDSQIYIWWKEGITKVNRYLLL